jgi:hypothetical protein
MANIGFTDKQLHVYDRFNTLRLAYQAKHGRTYAPGFLAVLMDAWEKYHEPTIEPAKKEPVVIKDGDNRYVNNATAATYNFHMSNWKDDAMVFDDTETAKVFLQACGREAGGWILEPV